MVLAASRRNSLIMNEEDLRDAHSTLEEVEEHMPKAFAGVGASALAGPYEFVIDLLAHSREPISHMTIVDRLKRDVRREEVDEILETLTLTGTVEKMKGTAEGTYTYRLRD